MVFLHVSRQVVILGLHIGEAVDAADNHGSVLAQTVQDHAQGVLTNLVGVAGNTDRALRSGEGLGLLVQQHRAQIAVTQTNLTLVGNGTGDAERLQTLADAGSSLGGGLHALLQRNSGAQLIGPLRIFEADGLNALDDLISVNALAVVVSLQLVPIGEAVLLQNRLQLRHAAFVVLKQSHFHIPPLITACGGRSKRPHRPRP